MAAAAAVLLATYLIGWVAHWDAAAFTGLGHLHDHEAVRWITHRFTRLADPLPTVLMLAAVCVAGFAWGRPRHAIGALLLVAGGAVAGTILKALLAHPRYGSLLGSEQLAADAYPSGHAIAAMSLGLAAVLVTPKRWRAWSAIGAAAYALAVGTALVINGWHYPSDILGGFLLAAGVGLTVLAAIRTTEHAAGDRTVIRQTKPALAPALGALAVTTLAILALALSRAGEVISYAEAHTSAVVAALVIALASVALVSAVAVEANER